MHAFSGLLHCVIVSVSGASRCAASDRTASVILTTFINKNLDTFVFLMHRAKYVITFLNRRRGEILTDAFFMLSHINKSDPGSSQDNKRAGASEPPW